MSYDLKLFRKCDHYLHRQLRSLDLTDMRSVRLATLMGSSQNARLFVNEVEVPKQSSRWGWSIVKDENSYDGQQRKILFAKQMKSTSDILEVSYYAAPTLCPKCGGIGTLYDYEYSNVGLVLKVENEDKLIQDQEKIILTILGSCIFHPWYGTSLVDLIGKKIPTSGIRSQVSEEISKALSNLKKLQQQQERYQSVTDREFLHSIQLIEVLPTTDPTLFEVHVVTRTAAGSEASFSKNFIFNTGLLVSPSVELNRRILA